MVSFIVIVLYLLDALSHCLPLVGEYMDNVGNNFSVVFVICQVVMCVNHEIMMAESV